MHKEDKERLVKDMTERLKESQTLIVADYRGLSNAEIDGLRGELLKNGAKFSVVKNTLTRRAAEAAGADALLALLEGPTAIAFLESDGDPAAVAKALHDAARTTRILTIRGGLLEGRTMSADEVETLAKLPPAEVVRSQLLGAITAPLTTIVALFAAPLQNLVGLIDARIEQLEAQGGATAPDETPSAPEETPAAADEVPAADDAPTEDAPADEAASTDETESGDDAPASEPASEEE
jgi:large subunit ribosomal protein L10